MVVSNDIYGRQHMALLPFAGGADGCRAHGGGVVPARATAAALLDSLSRGERVEFVGFLGANNLLPLWYDTLGGPQVVTLLGEEVGAQVRREALLATTAYLQQKRALLELGELLDGGDVRHLVFKGAHTRECVYPQPALRPACDIDLLVHADDKERAITLLQTQGYSLHALPENLSHEVSLHRGEVSVDLHYHILRPGRIPRSLTPELLSSRVRCDGFWGCPPAEELFIMLIHPVFSKYSHMTAYGLLRMVDLLFWLNLTNGTVKSAGDGAGENVPSAPAHLHHLDLNRLHQLLSDTGSKTAAWISLRYLQLFSVLGRGDALEVQAALVEDLRPGLLHRRYLEHWLRGNWPARLHTAPKSVQVGFTLFAHDRLMHSLRFVQSLFRDRSLSR